MIMIRPQKDTLGFYSLVVDDEGRCIAIQNLLTAIVIYWTSHSPESDILHIFIDRLLSGDI